MIGKVGLNTTGQASSAYQPAGHAVIARDFDSELVIANLDTGLFYSCGGSAGAIWDRLGQGWPVDAVASAFADPVAGAVQTAVEAFVASLQAEALIVPCPARASPETSLPLLPFDPPTMERFDDLQGLLLVDPIHDVTEQGWPTQANG